MAIKRCVVTGGGGFLGKALVRALRKEGRAVVSLGRGDYPELREMGAETVRVDLSDPASNLAEIFSGADVVFHVAAKVGMWGKREGFYRTNVEGTRRVIEACRGAGVKSLVYTSSPSVIADGLDLCGIDETYPYPDHHEALYPETKAIAEREVLAADGSDLYTCALRPHLIWGPGDTNLLPTIIGRAKAGKLVQVGDGQNRVDLTFIDDCVQAHLCAAKALLDNPASRGQAYFVSQGEPVNMWDWINEVLRRNALPPVRKQISRKFAQMLAAVSEFVVSLLPGDREPFLTRFLVSEMATHHYFSIEKARALLGYEPKFSIEQALEETFPGGDGLIAVEQRIAHGA